MESLAFIGHSTCACKDLIIIIIIIIIVNNNNNNNNNSRWRTRSCKQEVGCMA